MSAMKQIAAAALVVVVFAMEFEVVVSSLLTAADKCPVTVAFDDGKCTAVATQIALATEKIYKDKTSEWHAKLEDLVKTTDAGQNPSTNGEQLMLHVLTEAATNCQAIGGTDDTRTWLYKRGCALDVCEGRDKGHGATPGAAVLLNEILEEVSLQFDKAGTLGKLALTFAKKLETKTGGNSKKFTEFTEATVDKKNQLKASTKTALKGYVSAATKSMQPHLKGLFLTTI